MIDRTTKLRWRRSIRHGRRQVEDLGLQAEEHLERHFFRRIGRLINVRQFVVSWVLLVVFLIFGVILQARSLIDDYASLQPVPGGTFTEGLLGSFTDANPLYATGLVDTSVSRLLFSSLFKIDSNGKLVGDLARNITSDDRGIVYTVLLKQNLFWHDGKPLTSKDVAFTYQTIQNADAKSPLFGSWRGIKVEIRGSNRIIFTLPNSLSSFPYALVNGIVPQHLLKDVPPNQLRSVRFNTASPVGSGPFVLNTIEVSGDSPETREEKIGLKANPKYYEGKPKLDSFILRSFHDVQHLTSSFKKNELDAMVGLDEIPVSLQKQNNLQEYNVPLADEMAVFLKTSAGVLTDVKVRQALVQSVNQQDVIKNLGFDVVAANSPLLKGQIGYDRAAVQLPYDTNTANKLLDSAGWVRGADGVRSKNKTKLSFGLYAQDSDESKNVIAQLRQQWKKVGVDVKVQLQPINDLQTTVSQHAYDALLYGIAIGPDPDVFAYWHSSQTDPHAASRLNFSEYKSGAADKALEAGRTRKDPTIRAIKYRPFLDAWRTDAPAIMLYQPRFLYISRSKVFGFDSKTMDEAADRFSNVREWEIRQAKLPQ